MEKQVEATIWEGVGIYYLNNGESNGKARATWNCNWICRAWWGLCNVGT